MSEEETEEVMREVVRGGDGRGRCKQDGRMVHGGLSGGDGVEGRGWGRREGKESEGEDERSEGRRDRVRDKEVQGGGRGGSGGAGEE
jgi:hypothetical protein